MKTRILISAMLVYANKLEMPSEYTLKVENKSWQSMNKGKLSKKQRRK
jgi:hypothetical protein